MAKIKPFYTPSANTELLKYYTKTPATPARDSLRETADLIRKNYLPQNTSSLSRSAYKAENINHSATPAATPYQAGYKAENINHSVVPASATPAVRSAVSTPRVTAPAVRSTPSYTAASAVSPTTTSAMAPYTSAAATPTTTPTGTNPLTAYETEKQAEADRLAADKEAAEQAAWVSYQKLLKYMPTQNKANGLYGQGISESGALQAQSAYATRQGEIDTQYQDSMSDLEKYYTTKTETYLNQLYEQAKADIGNRPYATTEELQDFVRRNYGNLRDDQVASLMNLAKANDENISRADEKYARNRIAESYASRIDQYIDDGDYENAARMLERAKNYLTQEEVYYYGNEVSNNRIKQFIANGDYESATRELENAKSGNNISDGEYKYYKDTLDRIPDTSKLHPTYRGVALAVGDEVDSNDYKKYFQSNPFKYWLSTNGYSDDFSNIPDGATFYIGGIKGHYKFITFYGRKPYHSSEAK